MMQSGPEEQVTNSKRVVFITHSQHGTLGDPSSAIKLIKSFKQKYGTDSFIVLLVEIESLYVPKLNKIVPPGIHCIPWKDKKMEFSNPRKSAFNSALRQADAIVVYPTPHGLEESEMQNLLNTGVPVIAATEYDISLDLYESKLNTVRKPGVNYFGTGFGKDLNGQDNLGIFMTNEDPQRGAHWLSKISEDIFVRDFLLSTSNSSSEEDLYFKEDAYFENHSLFYGYYSNLNVQSPYCAINPTRFSILCILKMFKNLNDKQRAVGHTVDILIPLQDMPIGDTCFTNADTVMADLLMYFGKDLIKVEYYRSDNTEKLQLFKTDGYGVVVIRLINGTPFAPSTVDKILKASDPLCMMTGDQSFTEALSNKKTILYQIMLWKLNFFNEFINTVKICLGQESNLYKFLTLQKQSNETNFDIEEYMKYIFDQAMALQNEINLLASYLLKDKNLADNLPDAIMRIIELNSISKSIVASDRPQITMPTTMTHPKERYLPQEPIQVEEVAFSRKRKFIPSSSKKANNKEKEKEKNEDNKEKLASHHRVYKKPK